MKSKRFEIINYSFFSAVIVACLVLTIVCKIYWLSFVASASSILYIVLLSERNLLNFIVGFVSSTSYIVIAYQSLLYGEAIFYLVFDIPMIVVSFIMWKKHMETKYKVETKKLSIKNIFLIVLVSSISVVGYGFFLRAIGGENTFIDALSTVVTLTATILMALRYKEQWFMWIIVYAVSIVLWATTFNLLMLIMSISCFISSFIGYINWTISTKKKETIEIKND